MKITCWCLLLLLVSTVRAADRPDILVNDFEAKDYGDWKTTGDAFGSGPANGSLPYQMPVTGFVGHGLVNSFHGGDKATGTLTSPPFPLTRNFISFFIGGGGFDGKTCINLLIDGKIVRTATGPNTEPGGSEALLPESWDVSEFAGKVAQIQIVDNATGGWGHINVDQIVQTDRKPVRLLQMQKRELVATGHYIHIPVKVGAAIRKVQVLVGRKNQVRLDIALADGEPDWWAFMDASGWKGQTIGFIVDKLPEDSTALSQIDQSDEIKSAASLYHEALRPQLHFSSRRGWLNDPNGLVYFKGEYHLFYQHNPYGWPWGNMHWGHAVSSDLIHWEELGDVLVPDEMGPMFSGSAVVDWKNTSGLGTTTEPPMVLIYTAAGNPTVQCIASSTDGRHFTKFAGNPVVKEIAHGNRDPKVYWSDATGKWVMALFVGLPGKSGEKDAKGRAQQEQTIHFLTSPNLKDWTVASQIDGFFECPDYFELPVDGALGTRKWVLTAANSDYMVGQFDGQKFTPDTEKLKGQRGRGYYAAQTFAEIPAADGRRIQIGWLQAASPGMPFNQAMSLPIELTLRGTPQGQRMGWQPVKELQSLRKHSTELNEIAIGEGNSNPLAAAHGELLEVRADFDPATAKEVDFVVRGTSIVYDVAKQELVVDKIHAPAPLVNGRQRLTIYVDRTSLEIFASDGFSFIPLPMISKAGDLSVAVIAKGGKAMFKSLTVHELKSIWESK